MQISLNATLGLILALAEVEKKVTEIFFWINCTRSLI